MQSRKHLGARLFRGAGVVIGVLLAVWGYYTTAEDVANRSVPPWVWIAVGNLLAVGSLLHAWWQVHQENKDILAKLKESRGSAHDRLRILRERGLSLMNTWEAGWPNGPEEWRYELRKLGQSIGDLLQEEYPEAASTFRSIPERQHVSDDVLTRPGSDYSYIQRERLLEAWLAFISSLLNGRTPTVDVRDDRHFARPRIEALLSRGQALLNTTVDKYAGGGETWIKDAQQWRIESINLLDNALGPETTERIRQALGQTTRPLPTGFWFQDSGDLGERELAAWQDTTLCTNALRGILDDIR